MATLFKAISVVVALAILVPMNLFAFLHSQGGGPWFVAPINLYALACLMPNSVLAKKPKLLVAYVATVSLIVLGFVIVGIVEEVALTWDAMIFNGLAALVFMSPVVSVLLYRRRGQALMVQKLNRDETTAGMGA